MANKASVPSFLDFNAPGIDTGDRRNARDVTAGDPTRFKLNHVMVGYEGLPEIERCLQQHSYGIEYVKMPSASYAARKFEMAAFAKLCKAHNVIPYIGGGETEEAIREGRLYFLVRELQRFGIDTIEISNSEGDMPAGGSTSRIRDLAKDFNRVLVEIGTKDCHSYQTRHEWHRDLDAALDADATNIILEGSAYGIRGIYEKTQGLPNILLVTDLIQRAGDRSDRFLIEAPFDRQRSYWIDQACGWNARLGNIPVSANALELADQFRLNAMEPASRAAVEGRRMQHREFLRAVLEYCGEENMDPDVAIFHFDLHGPDGETMATDPTWREKVRFIVRSIKSSSRSTR